MILADTSVWIDHLRSRDERLSALLENRELLMHPFVIGEIALGHLPQRDRFLSRLQSLPQTLLARDEQVLGLIDRHRLVGAGVGYIDLHLVVSAMLSECQFWTRDRRLSKVCDALGLSPRLH